MGGEHALKIMVVRVLSMIFLLRHGAVDSFIHFLARLHRHTIR